MATLVSELSPARDTPYAQLQTLFSLVLYRYWHRGLPLPHAIRLMLPSVIDALFSGDAAYQEVMHGYFSSIVECVVLEQKPWEVT